MPYDVGGEMISAAASADPPPYRRARAVARYDGLMRDLIHGFKFHDTHDARRLFGRIVGIYIMCVAFGMSVGSIAQMAKCGPTDKYPILAKMCPVKK